MGYTTNHNAAENASQVPKTRSQPHPWKDLQMIFTMNDTSTPYGDPGDVYWDDEDDEEEDEWRTA